MDKVQQTVFHNIGDDTIYEKNSQKINENDVKKRRA